MISVEFLTKLKLSGETNLASSLMESTITSQCDNLFAIVINHWYVNQSVIGDQIDSTRFESGGSLKVIRS